MAFADLDNDGDQDVHGDGGIPGDNYRNALFLNPGTTNHWLKLKLEGSRRTGRLLVLRFALIWRLLRTAPHLQDRQQRRQFRSNPFGRNSASVMPRL